MTSLLPLIQSRKYTDVSEIGQHRRLLYSPRDWILYKQDSCTAERNDPFNQFDADMKQTPLILALQMNDRRMIDILTECGAKWNYSPSPNINTPLFSAAMQGKHDLVRHILRSTNFNPFDHYPNTISPTILHAGLSHLRVLTVIFEELPDLPQHFGDLKGIENPLICAAVRGHYSSFQMLATRYDANIYEVSYSLGWPPLMMALYHNHLDIVLYLLKEHRQDPNILWGDCRQSPLHLACKLGNYHAVKLLVSFGAQVKYDYFGESALLCATRVHRIDIVKQLTPLSTSKQIEQAMIYCCSRSSMIRSGKVSICRWFLSNGASIYRHYLIHPTAEMEMIDEQNVLRAKKIHQVLTEVWEKSWIAEYNIFSIICAFAEHRELVYNKY